MVRMVDEWLELESHDRTGTDSLLASVDIVEGIGTKFADRLAGAGVSLMFDLWAASPVQLSNRTGITPTKILGWQQAVDLMRIDVIGPQSAEVLVAAGVRTSRQLAEFEVAELHTKISAVLERRPTMIGKPPTKKAIRGWILGALTLVPPGAPLNLDVPDENNERGWSWQDPKNG